LQQGQISHIPFSTNHFQFHQAPTNRKGCHTLPPSPFASKIYNGVGSTGFVLRRVDIHKKHYVQKAHFHLHENNHMHPSHVHSTHLHSKNRPLSLTLSHSHRPQKVAMLPQPKFPHLAKLLLPSSCCDQRCSFLTKLFCLYTWSSQHSSP